MSQTSRTPATRATDLGYVTPLRCACGHPSRLDVPVCVACEAPPIGEDLPEPPTEPTLLDEPLTNERVHQLCAPAAKLAEYLSEQVRGEKVHEKRGRGGCLFTIVGLVVFVACAVLMIAWTGWFAAGAVAGLLVVGVSFKRAMGSAGFDLPDAEIAFVTGLVETIAVGAPEQLVGLSLNFMADGSLSERPPEKLSVKLLSAWPSVHGARQIVRQPWLRLAWPPAASAATPRVSLRAARWTDRGGEQASARRTGARQGEDERALQWQVHDVFVLHGDGVGATDESASLEGLDLDETAVRDGGLAELWRSEPASDASKLIPRGALWAGRLRRLLGLDTEN
jgi:hypothetical protein